MSRKVPIVAKLTHASSRRAPAPAEVQNTDDEVHSLVDVDSPHISSVPSDFESQEIKTETQQREHELEDQAREKEDQAREKADQLKQEADHKKEQAKKVAAKAEKNADNPVVIGNAVGIAALTAFLGYGAYRKHAAGELTWKLAGAWAGVVGLFAVGDYFTSQ